MTIFEIETLREQFIDAYRSLLIAEGMNIQDRHFEWLEGGFSHRETAVAWWAWQESRKVLVITLPKAFSTMAGPVMWADCVREAVDAQGLKVTE
ncbi:hypothetical protein ACIP61_01090 [Pseudomonas fulva]|uniref:hypothetical protein n=1 Tax=Pseudomonas fulva TaxID=47880 RepID=UPI000AA68400